MFLNEAEALAPTAQTPPAETDEDDSTPNLHAVTPTSLLGKALQYLHGQWPKLLRFVDNGTSPLDSNPVENAIRPFGVGRKSWLFADTVGGANASANLYSLIETAKANGVEP